MNMRTKKVFQGLANWSFFIILSGLAAIISMRDQITFQTFLTYDYWERVIINLLFSKSAEYMVIIPALNFARKKPKHIGLSNQIDESSKKIIFSDYSDNLDDFLENHNAKLYREAKINDIRNRTNHRKAEIRKQATKELKIVQGKIVDNDLTAEDVLDNIQIKFKPIQKQQLYFATEIANASHDIEITTTRDYNKITSTGIFGTVFLALLVGMITNLTLTPEGIMLLIARLGLMVVGIVKGFNTGNTVVISNEMPKLVNKVSILESFLAKQGDS